MNIKRFVTLSVIFLLALTMNACTLSAPATLVTQASEIPNTSGNRPQFIVEDNGLYIIENNEPRLLIDLTTLIIEASTCQRGNFFTNKKPTRHK